MQFCVYGESWVTVLQLIEGVIKGKVQEKGDDD